MIYDNYQKDTLKQSSSKEKYYKNLYCIKKRIIQKLGNKEGNSSEYKSIPLCKLSKIVLMIHNE